MELQLLKHNSAAQADVVSVENGKDKSNSSKWSHLLGNKMTVTGACTNIRHRLRFSEE
jgi:hypothetical protein